MVDVAGAACPLASWMYTASVAMAWHSVAGVQTVWWWGSDKCLDREANRRGFAPLLSWQLYDPANWIQSSRLLMLSMCLLSRAEPLIKTLGPPPYFPAKWRANIACSHWYKEHLIEELPSWSSRGMKTRVGRTRLVKKAKLNNDTQKQKHASLELNSQFSLQRQRVFLWAQKWIWSTLCE